MYITLVNESHQILLISYAVELFLNAFMLFLLLYKNVLQVTGANQGIGYGIVRRLCKEHPDWIVYGTSK